MKQMKRAVGLLLALVLVLSMAACGKKDGDGGDSQSGFQRGTIENGIYTNTFVGIGCQLSDDWTYYAAGAAGSLAVKDKHHKIWRNNYAESYCSYGQTHARSGAS